MTDEEQADREERSAAALAHLAVKLRAAAPEQAVNIDYTNWKGVRAMRRIVPWRVRFTSTPHHPVPQWMLQAFDLDRDDWRSFALCNVHGWRPVSGLGPAQPVEGP